TAAQIAQDDGAFTRAKLVFTESDERCGLTAELDGVKREGVPLAIELDPLGRARPAQGRDAPLLPPRDGQAVTRVLIVNADDFGLTRGVSRGILACYQNGIVTSTTLMVNRGAEPAQLEALKASGLGVGLHVNLTLGTPLSDP